mmetsp:Transcript_28660/g.83806  ORF Transcript_28660/g.83806 Transcript_28660/m.83806 type:complete len:200 (-) Transcript_28660:8-607(-)
MVHHLLHHHAHDRHHRKATVLDLGGELLVLNLWIVVPNPPGGRGDVSRSLGGVLLVELGLHEAREEEDLYPARDGDGSERAHARRDIRELDVLRLGKVAREGDKISHHVANGGNHRNTAVLDLHAAAAVEGGLAVLGKVKRIPEAASLNVSAKHVLHRCLDSGEGARGMSCRRRRHKGRRRRHKRQEHSHSLHSSVCRI